MTSTLDCSLTALDSRLAEGSPEDVVERVEAGADGVLFLTVEGDPQGRWFRFHDGTLEELDPWADERIPLCTALSGSTRGRLRILSWRPGRRIVLRDDDGGERTALKGYRRKRGEGARARLASLYGMSEDPAAFLTPRVMEWQPDIATIRMEWIDGARVGVSRACAGFYHRVGSGLRKMQAELSTQGLGVHGSAEELAVLERLASRTIEVTQLPLHWERARDSLVAAAESVREPAGVPVHRDLHDGQLLEVEQRVGLLDPDLLSAGARTLDVANLAAHLQLRVLQDIRGATQEGAEACGRALLDGLETDWSDEDRREYRFLQGTTYARLALVYAVRPRWAHLSPSLVLLAEQCCHDLRRD